METSKFSQNKVEVPYEHYKNKDLRRDIYHVSKELSKYLYKENVPNIVLIDRSPRQVWVGIDEYWKENYKDRPRPNIYFINPLGFNTVRMAAEEKQMSDEDILLDRMTFAVYGTSELSRESKKLNKEVESKFEKAYFVLEKDKDKPLVLFDNCIHTGDAIAPVLYYLENHGYKDIRVVIADTSLDFSPIEIDKSFDKHVEYISCNVFGTDNTGVNKGNDISSEYDTDADRDRVIKSREEVRRIIKEKGN